MPITGWPSDSAAHPRQLLECERSTPTGRPFGDRGWFRTELQLRPQDGKCLRAKVGPTLGSRVISKTGMQADKAGELRGSSHASIRNVPFAGTAPSSNWPDQLDPDWVHLEVTRDTNGPGKSACREPLSKRRAEAVSGIRQHTAKARTSCHQTIDLRQSDLPALAFILLSPSWRRGIASTCFAQVTARSFAH